MSPPRDRVLLTQRLLMEPMGPAVAPELFDAVVSQESVMRWLASGKAESREVAEEMCRAHAAHWVEHGYGDFAVREATTRTFLGRVGLRYRPEFGVDLGFAMSPEVEGRGIATEAGRACLNLAFGDLRMSSVYAFVLPENHRSISLVERLGAREAGTVMSSGNHCLRFRFDPPSGT